MSNIISINKRVTILRNVSISQKTSGGLGDFYVNNRQENKRRIGMNILYLVSCNLQRANRGFTKFKK